MGLKQWLVELERVDFLGWPIRFGKLLLYNLKVQEQYGMSDEDFTFWFVFLNYPFIFLWFLSLSTPIGLLMPLFLIVYASNRDMFVRDAPSDE
mmetsp:Transcript_6635/g.11167  ORF Transcript_6635/g.11167 Transcript_6635/m.11167 type:complete len:93 (+) Transcript_6635:223-501(+)